MDAFKSIVLGIFFFCVFLFFIFIAAMNSPMKTRSDARKLNKKVERLHQRIVELEKLHKTVEERHKPLDIID